MKKLIYIAMLAFLPFSALSAEETKEKGGEFMAVVGALEGVAKKRDEKALADLLSKRSLPMARRYITYDLAGCMPSGVRYAGSRKSGNFTVVRIGRDRGDGVLETTELAFVKENGWKIDLPETFKNGLGEEWEERSRLIEAGYLLMKAQFGAQAGCGNLNEMLRKG